MRARLTLIFLSLVLLSAALAVGCAIYSNSTSTEWRALSSEEKAAARRAGDERDLGIAADHGRKYKMALSHFENACRIYEKTFGSEHFYMSRNCYDDLCYAHYRLWDFEGARKYCEKGMALSQITEPQNIGQLARYENHFGVIEAGFHRCDAAFAHYERSEALFAKSVRPTHVARPDQPADPDRTWEIRVNVRACAAANASGRPGDGLPYCEKALALADDSSGNHDYDRALTLVQKGLVLKNLDRIDEAIPVLEAAIVESRRALGHYDMQTRNAQVALAKIYSHNGSLKSGEELFLEVLSTYNLDTIIWSSQLVEIYNELALNYRRQERGADAVEAAENAVHFCVSNPYLADEDWQAVENNLVAAKSMAGWGNETEADLRMRLEKQREEKLKEWRVLFGTKKDGAPKTAGETAATHPVC
ncbi:MAG: tetratricopeptide repeat protein [Deltaproteobacteria bacterium]|nr:tetratricopeptide repeat protein [Deltaproteobacteria bacterium]MCB9490330.1 tetratricopeptide repeat protein [Deltaproteobacteria bacterium]